MPFLLDVETANWVQIILLACILLALILPLARR